MSDGRKNLVRAGKFFGGWFFLTALILTGGGFIGWAAGAWVTPQLFFIVLFAVATPWSIGILLALSLVTVLAVISWAVMQYYAKKSEEMIVTLGKNKVEDSSLTQEVKTEVTSTLSETSQQVNQESAENPMTQSQDSQRTLSSEEDQKEEPISVNVTPTQPSPTTPSQASQPEVRKTPSILFDFEDTREAQNKIPPKLHTENTSKASTSTPPIYFDFEDDVPFFGAHPLPSSEKSEDIKMPQVLTPTSPLGVKSVNTSILPATNSPLSQRQDNVSRKLNYGTPEGEKTPVPSVFSGDDSKENLSPIKSSYIVQKTQPNSVPPGTPPLTFDF